MKNENQNRKKTLSLTLAITCSLMVIGILLATPALASESPAVTISPGSQTVDPGETNVCVQVHVNSDGVPVSALNFKLTYPTSFTLTSFTSYKLLGSSALEVGIPITPSSTGMIDYAQAQPYGATPLAINGNVATLCFTVSSTPGSYHLEFTDVTLLDGSGDPLTGFTPVDGTIIVNTVGPTGPTADCNGPYSGVMDADIQFYGSATGGTAPYSYYWTFGDGASSSQQNPAHSYSAAGTYPVTLQVTDDDSETDDCTTTATITSLGPIPPPYVQICPTDDTIDCPSHERVEPNSTFCIDIMVNSGTEQVKAINIQMTYPTEFAMTSSETYKLLGPSALEIPSTSDGMYDYAQVLPYGATPQTINGKLITLCFDVSGGTLDILYFLNIAEVTLLDENENPIPDITVVNASRTIGLPLCSPDVNIDGRVNVLDMILVGQHWGETGTPGWIPEDANPDGTINVLDMICIGQNWTG